MIVDESYWIGVFGYGYIGSGYLVVVVVVLENLKIIEECDFVVNVWV